METPNPAYIEEIKSIVKKSPFFDHMSMQLTFLDIGRATLELELGRKHFQAFGLVHGGVIATLIDTATFWAVFMEVPERNGLVNIDLKLNYLRAATGEILRAEGYSIRIGKSICYSEAHVFDEDNSRLAHGTSTLMIRPDSGLQTKQKRYLPVC